MPEERLQKVLAHAGVAARRRAEEMIVAGRVAVNGEVVTELGTKVNPKRDVIQVDGRPLGKPEKPAYFLVNKPRGVLSSASDARGRTTVVDLVPHHGRLYPVGRLDLDSEGLILLTNDGALALRLAHPRYEHEKEYRVLVEGVPDRDALDRLRRGVAMEGGLTKPARVDLERTAEGGTWLRIILREGRKRQIRRMLEIVGYNALRLIRVRIGPLPLGDLKPGGFRHLTPQELRAIQDIRQRQDRPPAREARPAGGKPPAEGRPAAGPHTRPGGRPGARPRPASSSRSGPRPAPRPRARPAARPKPTPTGRRGKTR
jgi:23S rRNA pseudouridine2605 synthase